jgi:MGT family glycosyltransferase
VELLTEAKINFKSIRDIAELALRIPELVLLPESFDLPGRVAEPRVHYVGAGVDLKRNEEPFSWDGIDSDRPVIYCARGSQVHAQRGPSRRFFQAAIDAAGARPDWQFIIAITKAFKIEEFGDVPPNVVLREWVPQLEVLSRASVMVHHGGFGTVKECLLIGVPMVSVPLIGFRDYRICTERIVHHGLGVQSDTDRITSSELVQLIAQVLNDQSFKRRVNLMREKFIQEDRLDIAVKVIEATISEIVGAASPDR